MQEVQEPPLCTKRVGNTLVTFSVNEYKQDSRNKQYNVLYLTIVRKYTDLLIVTAAAVGSPSFQTKV